MVTATDIYFHTLLRVAQQVDLLTPLLQAWIGDDYQDHFRADLDYYSYRPSDGFLFAIERNSQYQQSDEDCDSFRYKTIILDLEGRLSPAEHRSRIIALLELLWANGISTCTPTMEDDELPYYGGADGPVVWPG